MSAPSDLVNKRPAPLQWRGAPGEWVCFTPRFNLRGIVAARGVGVKREKGCVSSGSHLVDLTVTSVVFPEVIVIWTALGLGVPENWGSVETV
jgi:hypothetical protein